MSGLGTLFLWMFSRRFDDFLFAVWCSVVFIANIICEFLTRRDGTEPIGGDQDLHICQHLQNHRYAHGQAEAVVAQIGARHANRADHAFQAVRHDAFIGDGKQNVLASPTTLATPHENVVPLNAFSASSHPTDTMEQRIAYARIRSGITITALASAMGIHKDYYILIERKCDRIGPDNLLRFCSITGADPSWIVYGDEQPPMVPLSAPTIGQRIREYRLTNGITCKRFAQDVFHVPKSSSISGWESGRHQPELRTLMMIASTYGFNALSLIPPDMLKSGE